MSELLGKLVERECIPAITAQMLGQFAARWAITPYDAVLAAHVLSESELADAIARILGIDRVFHCAALSVESETLEKVPFQMARRWQCLAVGGDEAGVAEVVIADPTQKQTIAAISAALGVKLRLAVAERSDIVGAIDRLYPVRDQVPGLFGR